MQLNITGQHIVVTPSLNDYVTEKLERVQRHFDHVTTTHVVLSVEKTRQMAEATIHASGATIHANAEEDDMYAAIDSLSSKLDRQVIKHKEKLKDHRRNTA